MSLWSSVWWLFTVLLVVLSFEGLLTKGEAWSSSLPRGQQILPNSQGGGLLMAFPEGKKESKLLFDQCHPLVNPSRGIIKVEKSLSQKKCDERVRGHNHSLSPACTLPLSLC